MTDVVMLVLHIALTVLFGLNAYETNDRWLKVMTVLWGVMATCDIAGMIYK